MTRHLRGQTGQTLVIFTLVCAFLLLGTIALVGNTQVMFVNADRADSAALLGAQAGASAIDTSQLYYQNQVVLNTASAKQRCEAAARQVPYIIDAHCDVSGNTVTAHVTERVDLPVPLWSVSETLHMTRSARAAYGGYTGGF